MKLALTGDVMLGRLVNQHVVEDLSLPPAAAWGDTLPLFHSADLRLINLERVISSKGEKWRPLIKPFHFRAHPRALEILRAARIDGVTLANNHVLDYGDEALKECLTLLGSSRHSPHGSRASREGCAQTNLFSRAAGTISRGGVDGQRTGVGGFGHYPRSPLRILHIQRVEPTLPHADR